MGGQGQGREGVASCGLFQTHATDFEFHCHDFTKLIPTNPKPPGINFLNSKITALCFFANKKNHRTLPKPFPARQRTKPRSTYENARFTRGTCSIECPKGKKGSVRRDLIDLMENERTLGEGRGYSALNGVFRNILFVGFFPNPPPKFGS